LRAVWAVCHPRGFAHAILALTPDTEAFYLVNAHFAPVEERGVRWNDPRFDIRWPMTPTEIAPRTRPGRTSIRAFMGSNG
jgi:dTDP-4-dehydrorhamnose 3,5-epimerase-like enzyme